MNNQRTNIAFENFLMHIFKNLQFEVQSESTHQGPDRKFQIDLVILRDGLSTWVEVKFYRDDRVNGKHVNIAAAQLIENLKFSPPKTTGLLVVSAFLDQVTKTDIEEAFGIVIWDRSDLYNLIKHELKDGALLDEFEQLLLQAKQGLDTQDVFNKVSAPTKDLTDYLFGQHASSPTPASPTSPPSGGKKLCQELNAIPQGKPGWRKYEGKCMEILKYIFDTELANWDAQNTTDDELSRFDMICRVVQQTGFWGSLIQSFHTRYVLFEFKNYSDPIGQDQIYTTERYLYLRGLRSVGFIISRAGGKPQAFKASKGALREHGKLIMILTNEDLCKMLNMKDEGDNPSDHLSDLLDNFLISLSR